MVEKFIFLDSLLPNSSSTVPLRRLFRQHRPIADIPKRRTVLRTTNKKWLRSS